MGDARAITFGVGFGVETAAEGLDSLLQRLDLIEAGAQNVERAAQSMAQVLGAANRGNSENSGNQEETMQQMRERMEEMRKALEQAMQTGAEGSEELLSKIREVIQAIGRQTEESNNNRDTNRDNNRRDRDDLDETADKYKELGAEANNLGEAFHRAMGAGLQDTNSITKSLKTGLSGAIGFAEKKVKGFVSSFKTGAKNISNAIQHPVQFLRDRLSKALNDAEDDTENLGAEAEDAGGKLEDAGKEGGGAGEKISEAFKGAVTAIIGIEAIKAGLGMIKDFVGSAIEAAAAVESIGAKFDTVFGENADDASQWADNFSSAIHRSESEVKGFMVSSRAVASEFGITGEAADNLAKMTTSLGYDLGAAFKMDDAEAMDALYEGLRGNTEAMAQFGVSLDEATLQTQALKMGITSELGELDDAALAQVRMNAILEQTTGIQQSAAGETEGLVNSTKGLKAIFTDFMADAGGKFTPVAEGLFRSISDAWPSVEPMLMGFVTMLSDGLGNAVPVLLEVGQNLIPTLTSTLGTLFEAGMPLISVFSSLAGTVLPPLANIFGMLGETFLPPVVGILDTLNTAVIQPLMPPLQRVAEALLPPIARVLGLISPILETISPVIGLIGEGVAAIADALGGVIGWIADKGEKVTGFFSNLFGGAEKSGKQVSELSSSLSELDGAAASPVITPEVHQPEIKIPEVQAPEVKFNQAAAPQIPDLSYTVTQEGSQTPPQVTLPEADTAEYVRSVSEAMEETEQGVSHSWAQIREETQVCLKKMGTEAQELYRSMEEKAETAWKNMVSAAELGAEKIVSAFQKIGTAANGVNSAKLSIQGVELPHNAQGTDDFEGGWTHINEEGGELAYLPSGTAIIPADKSQELVSNIKSSSSYKREMNITAPMTFNITIEGGTEQKELAEAFLDQVKGPLKEMMKKVIESYEDDQMVNQSIQEAY